MDSLDHISEANVSGMLRAHHQSSAADHDETHEKLDKVCDKLHNLKEIAARGRSTYEGVKMDAILGTGAGAGGGLFGGGVGGLIGGAIGSLFGRGFDRGGFDRGFGGDSRMSDAIMATEFRGNGNEHFGMMAKMGTLEAEIPKMAMQIENSITKSIMGLEAAMSNQHFQTLMATERTQYDAAINTMNAERRIIENQQKIAFDQLKDTYENRLRDHERRLNDANITVTQITNQNQVSLMEERYNRRLDALFSQQNSNVATNKSVTIGSGVSGATSTNTNNNT